MKLSNHGLEPTAMPIVYRCQQIGGDGRYYPPEQSMQSGFAKSLNGRYSDNGRYCDEFLVEVLSPSLRDARDKKRFKRYDYNQRHPHSSIGEFPRAELAVQDKPEIRANWSQ